MQYHHRRSINWRERARKRETNGRWSRLAMRRPDTPEIPKTIIPVAHLPLFVCVCAMPVQYDTIINASQIRGASRCGHKNLYFPSLWFYVILLFFIPLFIFISQYLVLYNWCIHSLVHCEKQSFRFDANGALSDCVCRSSGRYLSTASWTNSRYAACCWWPKWTVPFFFFFEYLRKADEQYFLSAALGDGVTADTDSCITYMRTLWALVFHFSHHHIMAWIPSIIDANIVCEFLM